MGHSSGTQSRICGNEIGRLGVLCWTLAAMAAGVAAGCSSPDSDEEGEDSGAVPDDSDATIDDSGVDTEDSDADGTDVDTSTDTDTVPAGIIYVTISSSDEVVAIDEASREVVKRFPVGKGPAIILATPGVTKLYTANWEDNSVSAIDLATEQVRSIKFDGRPYVIAMAPDGKHVYAGLYSNAIAVIETDNDTVAQRFPTNELPASLIVSPDGETLYVATINLASLGLGAGTLRAISISTGELIHDRLTVGLSPGWITIGKDGSKVYTLNFLSDDITVVNTATWTVEATIKAEAGSQGIIGNVTPDGSVLCVTNYGTADFIAIDTATNTIIDTVELTGRPVGVNFNADGSRVYITDFGPESLNQSALQGATFLLTGVFNATGDGQVSVFDTATGELVGPRVTLPPGPTSVVVKSP